MSSNSVPGAPARRKARVAASAALFLLAAAGLSACGSSDSSTASSSGTSGDCGAPGVTKTGIKLGAILPLTGPSANTFSGFAEAAKARFDEANDAGGVNGRKISLVNDDDKGDGAQQVIAARNAVQSQKVFGAVSASRIDTMFDYLKQQNVPVVGYPGQPAYATDRNVFGFGGAAGTGYVSTALFRRLKAAGATNFASLAHNSPGAINSAKGYDVAATKVPGLKIGMRSWDVPLGSFDATATAIKMKEAGVNSVLGATLTDSSVSVLKAAKAQGVKLTAPYVAGVYDPNVYKQIADLLEGAIIAPNGTVPTQLETPATQKYVDTLKKYAPSIDPDQGFAAAGYVSADLYVKGLELAGDCLSRANFIDKLRALQGYDADGLLVSPAVFSPAELPDGTPYTKCAWYVTFHAGAWVPDKEKTCGELIKF